MNVDNVHGNSHGEIHTRRPSIDSSVDAHELVNVRVYGGYNYTIHGLKGKLQLNLYIQTMAPPQIRLQLYTNCSYVCIYIYACHVSILLYQLQYSWVYKQTLVIYIYTQIDNGTRIIYVHSYKPTVVMCIYIYICLFVPTIVIMGL